MWEELGLRWVCSRVTAESRKGRGLGLVLVSKLILFNAKGMFLYSHHSCIDIYFIYNWKQLAKPCIALPHSCIERDADWRMDLNRSCILLLMWDKSEEKALLDFIKCPSDTRNAVLLEDKTSLRFWISYCSYTYISNMVRHILSGLEALVPSSWIICRCQYLISCFIFFALFWELHCCRKRIFWWCAPLVLTFFCQFQLL